MASQDCFSNEVVASSSQDAAPSPRMGEPPSTFSSAAVKAAPVVDTAVTNEFVQESPSKKFDTLECGIMRPSFSYMIASASSGSSQQSKTSPVVHADSSNYASSLQPPVPGQSTSGSLFSYNISQASGPVQQIPIKGTEPALTESASRPAYIPPVPSLQVSPGFPRNPVAPAAPGTAAAMPLMSNVTVSSMSADSFSIPRPVIPSVSPLSNPSIQPQGYTPYPSVPPLAAQGPWLQPPPVGGVVRSPFSSGPYATPFPMAACGVPHPSISWPNSQSPGLTPLRAPVGTPTCSTGSADLVTSDSITQQPELPPGIDNGKHINNDDSRNISVINEQVNAWTAHRTGTGAIYYYNALTGDSTYVKPAGFKGEPDIVTAQSTPVSWEKLTGTDWTLVTTNDGKRYYYNTQTKLSSWQFPREVADLRTKQDLETPKAQPTSVTAPSVSTEKAAAPVSLNAPAINTGGRDATSLRSSAVVGSSSALDLIKKKLQDSGAPDITSPGSPSSGAVPSETNGSKIVESASKSSQNQNSKDKVKNGNPDGSLSDSSSDSEDDNSGPTKEDCMIQFKVMLKERGVAPFSKWEKELPKIIFDPRFKAIPSHSARRALFEHYVRTRAEEQRKERRAAQRAAVEGFKQLLGEAKEDIDHNTTYQTFKTKWGHDPRFEALDRKERESLLNERVLPLKRAAEKEAQAARSAAISAFKSMLREREDITSKSRWSKVKDSLRNDPRYKSVKHEDREALFDQYLSELKAGEEEMEQTAKAKLDEEEKLKERKRLLRKRKEREEQEVERVRLKTLRKEAVETYQALLVETIKDPKASWTESKPRLDRDPQGRAANPHLDQSDLEKLFREHVKVLYERCVQDFRDLLAEVITGNAALQEAEDGKTVLTSWTTAKRLLKVDHRYAKIPRKERESLWQRHVEDLQRRQKLVRSNSDEEKQSDRRRSSVDTSRYSSGSRRTDERR